jgi:hypothetical protein
MGSMHMTSIASLSGARTGWKGSEIDYREHGLHVFSEAELAEIERALRHLLALSPRDFTDVTPGSFPLERLGDYMRGLCDTLRNGPGFALLRGIPRERYSADEMAWIYVGLGSYLGRPTVQSSAGDVLGHVIDVHEIEPESRGYRKGGGQLMHVDSTDMCDVVGLMCLRTARSGGASRIASATAVYRDIERRRPDLAAALREGYYYRRTAADGKHSTRMQSPHRIAAFAETAGELSCYFVTAYIRRAAEHDSPLTPTAQEALREVERRASSPEFYLDMEFAEGDIQFLNNRVTFHGRTDYQDDHGDWTRRRHLMRLWLRVPEWPPLPESQRFSTDEDQRMWKASRTTLKDLPSTHFEEIRRKSAAAGKQ